MGGSCISKNKRHQGKKHNLYIDSADPPNNSDLVPSQYEIKEHQVTLFPCYHPPYIYDQPKRKNFTYHEIKQIIAKLTINDKVYQKQCPLVPLRSYLDLRQDKQSILLFNVKEDMKQIPKVQQINGSILVSLTLLQSLLFYPNENKIQIFPSHQYSLITGVNIDISEQSYYSPTSEDRIRNFFFTTPPENENGEISINIIRGDEAKTVLTKFDAISRHNLSKNCLFNGICSQVKSANKISLSLGMKMRQFLDIFGQSDLSNQCEVLWYVNPVLAQNRNINSKSPSFRQYTTYLQLKSLIQDPFIDIYKLFRPQSLLESNSCELLSIYILIFTLKFFMHNNQSNELTPIVFLEDLLKLRRNEDSILIRVANIMKLCFFVSIASETEEKAQRQQYKWESVISSCVQKVIKQSLLNSYILLDAYLIEFSIQLNEKIVQIRHYPFEEPQQKIKFSTHPITKINNSFLNKLKQSYWNFEQSLSHALSGKQLSLGNVSEIIENWEQAIKLHGKTSDSIDGTNSTQQSTTTLPLQNPKYQNFTNDSITLAMQKLSIKLYRFMLNSHVKAKLMNIERIQFSSIAGDMKIVYSQWETIINDFLNSDAYTYCSPQIVITILTIDTLVRLKSGNLVEGLDKVLNKSIDIWMRIYRDPRHKYASFYPNYWIIYIAQIISEIKRRGQNTLYSAQNIYHLQNIVQCLYSDSGIVIFGFPTQIEWILKNIPLRNVSGLYFLRADLLQPLWEEGYQSKLIKSNILADNYSNDLSSKSNYSEAKSQASSTGAKVKKRNRFVKFESSLLIENKQVAKNGLYIWGKGYFSCPLIYPFSKNLQVLKISCGNYHVVLGTSSGIFGWGENGSGQLGGQSTKENIKTIKTVLSRPLTSKNELQLSCGNEHTAILIKGEKLIMLGQSEGGIVSGSGFQFDSISCGGLHTLGILNGKVYSWGRGEGGQLGHKAQDLKRKIKQQSTQFYLDSPKIIQGLPRIIKSVCGDAHSILLSEQGQVYVFGFSYQGQLGLGITGESEIFQIFQPEKLCFSSKQKKNIKIVDIFAGSTFTFFKSEDGEVYSCGLNDCNQLGLQKMMKVMQKKKYLGQQKKNSQKKIGEIEFSRPNKLEMFNSSIKLIDIFCGENHCLALVEYFTKNRLVMGWGLNKQFQISCEFGADNIGPRTIQNIYEYHFDQICCGSNFSIGLINNKSKGLVEVEERIEGLKQLCIKYKMEN